MKYNFPRLENAKDFERLVRDYFRVKYGEDFQLYGRNGQKQYGVDAVDPLRTPQVQSKNYALKEKDIDKILDAHKMKDCKAFYIACSGDRDAKLQDYVSSLSKSSSFPIYILFWDDFEELLSNNEDIRRVYYPSFDNDTFVDKFKDLVRKHRIAAIIRDDDPALKLFKMDDASDLELFCEDLKQLWTTEDNHPDKNVSDKIKLFLELIREYHLYLSRYFFPLNGDICKLDNCYGSDFKQFEQNTLNYRQNITKCYYEITGDYLNLTDF